MKLAHGFFILEESNCIDKPQIIKILSKNIFEEKECIYCFQQNFKKFDDV